MAKSNWMRVTEGLQSAHFGTLDVFFVMRVGNRWAIKAVEVEDVEATETGDELLALLDRTSNWQRKDFATMADAKYYTNSMMKVLARLQ